MKQPFVDLRDADGGFLEDLVRHAIEIKRDPESYSELLKGKLLYGLYQKTSTRTHLSFARAMSALGGVYVWQSWESSNFAISDVESEGKYVSTTADAMIARLIEYEDIQRLAGAVSIPLINGCCNRFHPTQAVADLLTVYESFGRFESVRVLYFGVWNNILNSLALAFPRVGANLVALTPVVNPGAHDPELLRELVEGGNLELDLEPTPARLKDEIQKADVIYTDTWVDMEAINDPELREATRQQVERMRPFALTEESYGSSRALIMHCMPVHVGYEIDRTMVDHERNIMLAQADNRTHGQRAILSRVLAPAA